MAVTYTTAALVKKRIEHIDASLTDGDIDQFIYEAEGKINVAMKATLVASFDATKHAIIRSCATDIAAFTCLTYNPEDVPSIEAADMTANMLWNAIHHQLETLSDPRTVEYLQSL